MNLHRLQCAHKVWRQRLLSYPSKPYTPQSERKRRKESRKKNQTNPVRRENKRKDWIHPIHHHYKWTFSRERAFSSLFTSFQSPRVLLSPRPLYPPMDSSQYFSKREQNHTKERKGLKGGGKSVSKNLIFSIRGSTRSLRRKACQPNSCLPRLTFSGSWQ